MSPIWVISKTYDLFDSLVKDIFIGAIIYGIPSNSLSIILKGSSNRWNKNLTESDKN
jgi:hypothetical protein